MSLRIVSIAPLILSLLLSLQPSMVFAQAANQNGQTQATQLTGTRKQLATIIFAGLAGAILGLSTLSFYGKPQERLDNIAVGAALGIIGGAMYTTYQVARAPYDAYDVYVPSFTDKYYAQVTPQPSLQMNWEF